MKTKVANFKEIYDLINGTIYEVFEHLAKKHRYILHDLYRPYFKNWSFFCDDINISYYVTQDPDFFGICSIPLEVVVDGTWKDYIDSGEWLKNARRED